MFEEVFIPLIVFYFIFKIFELYVRRGERLRLIEKIDSLNTLEGKINMDYSSLLPSNGGGRNGALKVGFLLLGMGVGLLVALFLAIGLQANFEKLMDWYFSRTYEVLAGICIFIFGGLGLIIPSIILRKQDDSRNK